MQDCMVCAIYPLINYARIFGMFPISYKCKHTPKDHQSYVRRSRFGMACSYAWLVILLTVSLWYFYLVSSATHMKLKFFKLLNDFVLIISSGIVLVGKIHRNRAKIMVLKTWNRLLSSKKNFGVPYLLSEENTKALRHQAFVYVSAVTLSTVTIASTTLATEFKSPRTIINALVAIFDSLSILYFNSDIHFLQILMTNIKVFIQACLAKNYRKNIGLLEIKLQRILRLYSALYHNFQNTVKLFRFYFLLWLCLTTLSIIIDIYLCVVHLVYDYPGKCGMCLELRSFYIILLVIYWLQNIESLSRTSDDLLSFLFKYRISSLTSTEADQVELLIKTLILQKPVLKASDVFTVGTRLLAPISGTVVTYVLVALQFHEAKPN